MAEERRGQHEEVPRSHEGDTGGRPRKRDEEYPKGRSHYEFGTHGGPGRPPVGEKAPDQPNRQPGSDKSRG